MKFSAKALGINFIAAVEIGTCVFVGKLTYDFLNAISVAVIKSAINKLEKKQVDLKEAGEALKEAAEKLKEEE